MPPQSAPLVVCSYAHITACSESVFANTAMRLCYTCGEHGMHHHFCALDDKARGRAADPGGPGTSLCAGCAGLDEEETNVDGPVNVQPEHGTYIVFTCKPVCVCAERSMRVTMLASLWMVVCDAFIAAAPAHSRRCVLPCTSTIYDKLLLLAV